MKKIFGLLVLLVIIVIPIYVYTSSTFERNVPNIQIRHTNFWNLRDKFKINIEDESGIKFYKIVLINDNKADILLKKEFDKNEIKKNLQIELKLPPFYNIRGDKGTQGGVHAEKGCEGWFITVSDRCGCGGDRCDSGACGDRGNVFEQAQIGRVGFSFVR